MTSIQEPQFEFENCTNCNGEGKTYWLGPEKPCFRIRVCEVCYGMGKRPKQLIAPLPPPMPVDLPLPTAFPSIPASEPSK